MRVLTKLAISCNQLCMSLSIVNFFARGTRHQLSSKCGGQLRRNRTKSSTRNNSASRSSYPRYPVLGSRSQQHYFSSVISDRKVIGHCCSTVPLKSPWWAFRIVQRYKHSVISLISDSHTTDITHCFLGEEMYNSSVHVMLNIKVYLRECVTLTQVVSLALLPELYAPQC